MRYGVTVGFGEIGMLSLERGRSRTADHEGEVGDDKPSYGWLPDQWARDERISAACLSILAYRCTFADEKRPFGLWEDYLSKERILAEGFGESVRAQAIRDAVILGLLDRPHNSKLPRGPGYTFRRSIDHLNLPEHLDHTNSRMVWRSWFRSVLTCKEMSALLFLRVGTGKGRGVYERELRKRFGWSPATTLKVLRGLRSRGIVVMERVRRAKGRVDGVIYLVRPDLGMWVGAAASEETATHKKSSHGTATHKKPSLGYSGDGPPTNGSPGDIRKVSPNASPSEDSPERKGEYTSRLAAGGPNDSRQNEERIPEMVENAQEHAWKSPKILGWVYELALRDSWDDIAPELVEQVGQVHSDQQLADLVKTATAGRVHKSILSPAGCYGVRYLAASLLIKHDGTTPEDALEQVLHAMWVRIGSRPDQWLNSLGVLGQRFDGETCEGEEFFAGAQKSKPNPFEGYVIPPSPSEYEDYASDLMARGEAISQRQAEQIATIMLDPFLNYWPKQGLVYLVRSKGASFDIDTLTPEDIREAAEWAAAKSNADPALGQLWFDL